ncbi:V-type ATP synthase subunit D, partial [Geoglobus sp.]
QEKLALAMAADGVVAVKSIALSVEKGPTFTLKRKNIMGVVVPVIKREVVRKSLAERNYGVIGTTARVDEAVEAYEALIDAILEVAEVETTLKKLIEEIERTKRRVNALEFKVIPEMEEAARYITFKLEEMDRENIIRLKKIKSKKEQQAEA